MCYIKDIILIRVISRERFRINLLKSSCRAGNAPEWNCVVDSSESGAWELTRRIQGKLCSSDYFHLQPMLGWTKAGELQFKYLNCSKDYLRFCRKCLLSGKLAICRVCTFMKRTLLERKCFLEPVLYLEIWLAVNIPACAMYLSRCQ